MKCYFAVFGVSHPASQKAMDESDKHLRHPEYNGTDPEKGEDEDRERLGALAPTKEKAVAIAAG